MNPCIVLILVCTGVYVIRLSRYSGRLGSSAVISLGRLRITYSLWLPAGYSLRYRSSASADFKLSGRQRSNGVCPLSFEINGK
jgi:hypothetical protein